MDDNDNDDDNYNDNNNNNNNDDDDGYGYNDDDDGDEYDIWHRPPMNEELNDDGRHLIETEYDTLGMDKFIELMTENETECDKLSQLLCNKKLTSKDLRKENRDCNKYELFDILRLNDDNDDGGLNADDYDIDMREMEHLFNSFNNDILNVFMDKYYDKKLPFEPYQPYPMGLIETDINKYRNIKMMENVNYMNQHRRKNKQRLRDKYKKKKEMERRKRRKEKKLKMKLAKKKRDILKDKLSKQLAPSTLDILFNPKIIDPNNVLNDNNNNNNDDDMDKEEEILEIEVDDEALGIISSESVKDRIKTMRIQREKSRRKDRMEAERHSQAIQSPVVEKLGYLINNIENEENARFDDDIEIAEININQIFDEQQLNSINSINSMRSAPSMSADYDGTVKRYSRPIKMDQIEKVYKYVLFRAAYQYFGGIYLKYNDIEELINIEIENNKKEYNEFIIINGINNDNINYYINQLIRRDTDLLIQKYYTEKQGAMLQLMSMGVDLDDIENDYNGENMSFGEIKQSFINGIDGNSINIEDKLINHDEDDDNHRMTAIIYDSDDDKINDNKWKSRGKWIQRALSDFCENEIKTNTGNPKPWKKLHSKYVDEFVAKFCGFYPFESRPIAWKRVWHCYTNDDNVSYDEWPNDWLQQFGKGTLNMTKLDENIEMMTNKINNHRLNQLIHNMNDNNIPKLAVNLQDIKLPRFVWKLNECQLSKYGTYLLTNWKQSTDGKVTTNNHNERYPLPQFRSDIEQRRWHSEQKWYIYRLRYWKSTKKDEDILDFLNDDGDDDEDDDDDDNKDEGVEWFGSNDIEDFELIEDRICIQNDHCYGKPQLFLWSHDFCNDTGKYAKPIKIRNYGISSLIASSDPIIQSEKSIFNLNSPLISTGFAPCDGVIKSGTSLVIGARDHMLEYDSNINGILAMDVYIPPIFNLSVYDDIDTINYNWNRVNHDNIPDSASSKTMMFKNKNIIFDKLINDENNILKCWDDTISDWMDYNNFPVFDPNHHQHPSILSNAFFFHNFLSRTFYYGSKNIAKINYPRNWQNAIYNDDEWTLSFGFTHPRPIAPEKYAVLLYKKDGIEVRITSDTTKMDKNEIDNKQYSDHDNDDDEFEIIDNATKYKWTQERLEIMLNINCHSNGKQKSILLFSEIIRNNFNEKDCFYDKTFNKKFIFTKNYFMSHIVILSKSLNGEIKCYLDGIIVCNTSIQQLIGKNNNNDIYKTNILNIDNDNDNHLLIAHKPGNKKGSVHGLFHGYLYGISLHSLVFEPYELNTFYRQLNVHRDLHTLSLWFRNKKEQSSKKKYKQFL